MKKFLLILLFTSQLFSASIYTLDNIHDLNLYIDNQTDFMDKKEIKDSLTQKLKKAGFVFGEIDALILVIKIKSLEIEDSMAIVVSIGLGEEVITRRKDKIETFSYTYIESKFIEGYDPKEDTTEALDTLINDFIEAYEDDNT
ncbi:MAG: hypothetical protein COA44_06940 [Arcobacter sp.]|nr:MAG: hypothetical protein COA44_06940 [Arcobacter sp.]